MIAEKQTKSNIGVGLGIVLELVGYYSLLHHTSSHNAVLSFLGLMMLLVGVVAFVWGCINYAQGKGYSWVVGIVGLLGCLGLVVLIVLPDKFKKDRGANGMDGDISSQPGVWLPPPTSTPSSPFMQPPTAPSTDPSPVQKPPEGGSL